jgi:predicted AlkP superfamily phosphohydrolase/phosphomutase
MRTLILGFDAFDPAFVERLFELGRLPNLARYVDGKGYRRLSVSNPSQSEVSWTSIATGLNPGGHGIFDFVHRDPKTYALYVSLAPTKTGLTGRQFVPPHTARTMFDQVARDGYPATTLWWPATFPAQRGSPVRTLPGLGTPDLHGRLGVGTLLSTDQGLVSEELKTHIELLRKQGRDRFAGKLEGPARKKVKGVSETSRELSLELIGEKTARLRIGRLSIDLLEGQWSPIIDLSFRLGLFMEVHTLTRVILTSIKPDVNLYFLPLQLHPLHSPWPYGAPQGFVKSTWRACGPFLTVGWPQDTTGLEEGCISDQQFLDLCNAIFDTRERILTYCLKDFTEGILASVFDTLDRIQHMYWRSRPDIVEQWYLKMDSLVGRVTHVLRNQTSELPHIVIVSDHGFANYDYKVHLNRWLIQNGYMTPKDQADSGNLKDVDWRRTKAYAIGLNSIYLNLARREGQGVVEENQIDFLSNKLRDELLNWRGPDHNQVVQKAWTKEESLEGSLKSYGPDILIGYTPGYRASPQTGLGEWRETCIEPNTDHWNADHCINPQSVPGVLFSNKGLEEFSNPSYRDIPGLVLKKRIVSNDYPSPPLFDNEEEEIVEERLKSLGYL